MSECFSPEVRDFLPDLVHGKLGETDTATLLAHVEACDACAAELALLREVRASAPLAPSIDVVRVAAAIPARPVVTPPEAPRPTTSRPLRWRFVATAAVVVAAAVLGTQLGPDASVVSVRGAQSPSVAESISTAPASAPSLALVAAVGELTDEQIETLLTELDEIDAIPSAEPDPASVSVEGSLGETDD